MARYASGIAGGDWSIGVQLCGMLKFWVSRHIGHVGKPADVIPVLARVRELADIVTADAGAPPRGRAVSLSVAPPPAASPSGHRFSLAMSPRVPDPDVEPRVPEEFRPAWWAAIDELNPAIAAAAAACNAAAAAGQMLSREPTPDAAGGKAYPDVFAVPLPDLAAQWALIDARLFAAIPVREVQRKAWSRPRCAQAAAGEGGWRVVAAWCW